MKFTIPGHPQPQERALVLKRGWSVDRPASRKAKQVVAWYAQIARQAHKDSILGPEYAGSVSMRIGFYGAHGSADGDNLQKLVWDALQGILFKNDKQISSWSGSKEKAEPGQERTEIEIEAGG